MRVDFFPSVTTTWRFGANHKIDAILQRFAAVLAMFLRHLGWERIVG